MSSVWVKACYNQCISHKKINPEKHASFEFILYFELYKDCISVVWHVLG